MLYKNTSPAQVQHHNNSIYNKQCRLWAKLTFTHCIIRYTIYQLNKTLNISSLQNSEHKSYIFNHGWKIFRLDFATQDVSKKSKVLPKPHGPMGRRWSPFPISLSQTPAYTAKMTVTYEWNEWMNEWKRSDLKCVQKPTRSRLSLTHHANKSSRWTE